jgi:hypothetical protein
MKKIIFILVILITTLFIFGCTNPKDIALANPKIKEFLEEYPDASITSFSEYSAYDVIDNKDFWSDCEEKIEIKDYYKAVFENQELQLNVLFDKGRIKLVCGILDNKIAPGNITKPKDETITSPNSPVECNRDIDCFINAASTCRKSFFTSEFGTKFSRKERKYEKCILHRTDNNDDCPFEISALTSILKNWKNGSYSSSDFDTCGQIVSEPLPEVCKEEWNCGEWDTCVNGTQNRVCNEINSCGTDINKPILTQTCVVTPECEEVWVCQDWKECIDGIQTRNCFLANDCGYGSTEITSRAC